MEIPKKIYIDGPTSEFDNHWSIYQNNDSIEHRYATMEEFINEIENYFKL